MRILISIFGIFSFEPNDAIDCDALDASKKLLGAAGTAVSMTNIPGAGTAVSILGQILVGLDGGSCATASITNLIEESQRKQEAIDAKLQLRGVATNMKSAMAHPVNQRYGELKGILKTLVHHRYAHLHTVPSLAKLEIFSIYANVELNLIENLIRLQPKEIKKLQIHEKEYARALIYYLKRGSEYYTKYPMELFNEEHFGQLSSTVKYAANKALGSDMKKWIYNIENNSKIQNRIRLVSKRFKISNGKVDWWSIKDEDNKGISATFLPLPLSDGDWVSMRVMEWNTIVPRVTGEDTWLSCWGSVSDSDWCRYRRCPAVWGGQGNNHCSGERFQIQTTHRGNIKSGDDVAFKYAHWDRNEGRGKGDYWLSWSWVKGSTKYAFKHLYTEKCPGSSFTKRDIIPCAREVFTILPRQEEDLVRNGDIVTLIVDLEFDTSPYPSKNKLVHLFIFKQFFQEGEKKHGDYARNAYQVGNDTSYTGPVGKPVRGNSSSTQSPLLPEEDQKEGYPATISSENVEVQQEEILFDPVWHHLAPFGPVWPRLAPLSPAWPLFNFHLKVL